MSIRTVSPTSLQEQGNVLITAGRRGCWENRAGEEQGRGEQGEHGMSVKKWEGELSWSICSSLAARLTVLHWSVTK